MLQSRLSKVIELRESLVDGTAQLRTLDDHIANKTHKIPPRAKETMERDLVNLK
jgi:hypothetical protein